MIAVGSWRAGVKDAFSNCGTWVNGIAPGAKAVSRYPSPTTKHWAKWSGTSFATPQVSARLVGGAAGGVARGEAIGACP
jgi:subtilisin family serine protease